jgi:hypothetical protein
VCVRVRAVCCCTCLYVLQFYKCEAVGGALRDCTDEPRRSLLAECYKDLRYLSKCNYVCVQWEVRPSLCHFYKKHRQIVNSIMCRSLRPHSHCKPSRTEPIRLGKQTYVMKWKHSHSTPNRTGPSRTERVHWLIFVFTNQPTTDSVAQ